jgi:hypothetical protein
MNIKIYGAVILSFYIDVKLGLRMYQTTVLPNMICVYEGDQSKVGWDRWCLRHLRGRRDFLLGFNGENR